MAGLIVQYRRQYNESKNGQEEKKRKRVKEIADRKALKEEKKRMATNNTHAKAVEGVSATTNADANEVWLSSSTIVDLEQRVLNNLSEWKDPDPSTNTTWRALQENKKVRLSLNRYVLILFVLVVNVYPYISVII